MWTLATEVDGHGGEAKALRQLRVGGRGGIEAENPATVGAAKMEVRTMVGGRTGSRKPEHAARIDRLMRQFLADQPVEYAVKRDAVDSRGLGMRERRLDFRVTERSRCFLQQGKRALARPGDAGTGIANGLADGIVRTGDMGFHGRALERNRIAFATLLHFRCEIPAPCAVFRSCFYRRCQNYFRGKKNPPRRRVKGGLEGVSRGGKSVRLLLVPAPAAEEINRDSRCDGSDQCRSCLSASLGHPIETEDAEKHAKAFWNGPVPHQQQAAADVACEGKVGPPAFCESSR